MTSEILLPRRNDSRDTSSGRRQSRPSQKTARLLVRRSNIENRRNGFSKQAGHGRGHRSDASIPDGERLRPSDPPWQFGAPSSLDARFQNRQQPAGPIVSPSADYVR